MPPAARCWFPQWKEPPQVWSGVALFGVGRLTQRESGGICADSEGVCEDCSWFDCLELAAYWGCFVWGLVACEDYCDFEVAWVVAAEFVDHHLDVVAEECFVVDYFACVGVCDHELGVLRVVSSGFFAHY